MKTKNKKEKRVVNIDKTHFDEIKGFCDANAFDMPKWIEKIASQEINNRMKTVITIIDENLENFVNKLKARQGAGYVIERIYIGENIKFYNESVNANVPLKGAVAVLSTNWE
jgi:hypothetical protein